MLSIGNHTYEFRLIGGNTPYEGRFEVRRDNSSWGSVCGLFTSKHSQVACRSMGFSEFALSPDITGTFYFGTTSEQVLSVNACSGRERSVLDCQSVIWREFNLDHCRPVGLHCLPGWYIL